MNNITKLLVSLSYYLCYYDVVFVAGAENFLHRRMNHVRLTELLSRMDHEEERASRSNISSDIYGEEVSYEFVRAFKAEIVVVFQRLLKREVGEYSHVVSSGGQTLKQRFHHSPVASSWKAEESQDVGRTCYTQSTEEDQPRDPPKLHLKHTVHQSSNWRTFM